MKKTNQKQNWLSKLLSGINKLLSGKKNSGVNLDDYNDPDYSDDEVGDTYDLGNGMQLTVTSTWDMQANSVTGDWVISDKAINFKGVTIPNPMFYMGKIPKNKYSDPSSIDPSLPVAKSLKGFVQDLGYWPSYSDMTASQRKVYIDWLATGRKDPDINIGYIFVYYYGLERRMLVDGKDVGAIVNEIKRLRSIYDNNSFQSYSSNLLSLNSVKNIKNLNEDFLKEAFPAGYGGYRYSEEKLNAIFSWNILNQKPLSWKWALVAAENDPRSPSSVVTKRVKDEFEDLFKKRYEEKCGNGIMLRSAKRYKVFSYNPASSALSSISRSCTDEKSPFAVVIPNALGITSQFKPLVEIWTRCIEDLKAFSRQKAKLSGNEPLTAEAWEKLPPELQAQFDHPESGAWSKVIEMYIEEGTVAWVPTNEFAALKDIPVRDKLTLGQSLKIAETAANLGYAIEPDARLLRKGYAWKEKLAIFHDPNPNEHLDAKSSYSAASVMLHLAMSIAAADGHVAPEELKTITEFLDNQFDLSESERKRLTACGNYLMSSKINLAGIGKRIQAHLDDNQLRKVGRFLVAVAAADGVFEKSEIAGLKKAYKSMGLEPADAVSEIEKIKAVSTSADGEQIPPRPTKEGVTDGYIALDPEKIIRKRRETREAFDLLKPVFTASEDEDDETDTEPVNIPKPPSPVNVVSPVSQKKADIPKQQAPTVNKTQEKQSPQPSQQKTKKKISLKELSPEYWPFVNAVIKKIKWTESDMRSLADEHKVMVNGAIDAINEWSDDELGEFLIDCDEPYTIKRELLKR